MNLDMSASRSKSWILKYCLSWILCIKMSTVIEFRIYVSCTFSEFALSKEQVLKFKDSRSMCSNKLHEVNNMK